MYNDLHCEDHNRLRQFRPHSSDDTEILYADDTILLSTNTAAINRHIAAIQQASARYGLKLNEAKCEYLLTGANNADVHFIDRTPLKRVSQAKYLGVILSDTAQAEPELRHRMRQAMATWRKLDDYWKRSRTEKKLKLNIYDAVIRAKLLYAAETLTLTNAQQKRLNTFQYKGIRKIMKWHTTYYDRRNTNARLIEAANQAKRKPNKPEEEQKTNSWRTDTPDSKETWQRTFSALQLVTT